MSRNRQPAHASSDSDTESEVEYEPLVVETADGNQVVLQEETNPLAPIVVSPTVIATTTTSTGQKIRRPKKGKVFVTRDTMLALVESVNVVQDDKVKNKMDRSLSYQKRVAHIEEAAKDRKSKKDERLNKIKENLRKGGVQLKGENRRKVQEIRSKDADARDKRKQTGGRSGKPKKRVSFASNV